MVYVRRRVCRPPVRSPPRPSARRERKAFVGAVLDAVRPPTPPAGSPDPQQLSERAATSLISVVLRPSRTPTNLLYLCIVLPLFTDRFRCGMACWTQDDAKIGVSIQKNVPGLTPDPLSGLKVRESGIFRTSGPGVFSLRARRMRLLMSCPYHSCASFASTHNVFTRRRKMLWRIYGRVLGVPKSAFRGWRHPTRMCDTSLERSFRAGSIGTKIAPIRREMAEREVAAFWSFSPVFTS
jgi:hypothetical protein